MDEMDMSESEKSAKYFSRLITRYYRNAEVQDVLTDIRHWCAEYEVDFDDALQVSKTHFEKERKIHNRKYGL